MLRPGGRYAIHELGLAPDTLAVDTKVAVRRDLARAIKVNARGAARKRVLSMKRTFTEYRDHLTAVGKVVHRRGDVRAVNIALAAGAALSEHATAHPIYVHVLAGAVEFTCRGRTDTLDAGALVFVDRDIPQAVTAVAPSSMLITFLA